MTLPVDGAPGCSSASLGGAVCGSPGVSEGCPLLGAAPEPRREPLSQAELEREAGGPVWRARRARLVLLFWLGWLAMLCAAIATIAQGPWPRAPRRPWWQGALFCQLQPALFLDSDRDGVGDIKGLQDGLPYLRSLGVNALLIGGLLPRGELGSVSNLTHINRTLGTEAQFQELLAHCSTAGVRVLLDLCNVSLPHGVNLPDVSRIPRDNSRRDGLPVQLGALKRALRVWLERGLAGFTICDTDPFYSEQTLQEWRDEVKRFSSEDNERIVVVWRADAAVQSVLGDPGPAGNSSLADLTVRPLLPTAEHNLTEQEVAVAVETVLQRPQEPWPGWTMGAPAVGQLASESGELQRLLTVLVLTLPGTPVVLYGDEAGFGQSKNGTTDAWLTAMDWGCLPRSGETGDCTGAPSVDSVEGRRQARCSQLQLFRSLSHTRSREGALLFGSFAPLPRSRVCSSPSCSVLGFLRSWACVRFLVLLNFGPGQGLLEPGWAASLPPRGVVVASSGMDRLGAISLETLWLAPQEAVVIKLFEPNSFS
nr:PREDICTED: 4F2 cell-surface antigen heavy chain-like isoform X1 [Lepisosteus oculatus]